jgi:predicted regulator of Ras-like GTPase activity (Roadblock/LC7/MglB family)
MEGLTKVEQTLKELMDEITEIEGAVISSHEGILAAKVIYDDMDTKISDIGRASMEIAVAAARLGEEIQKAALREVIIEYEEGSALITGQGDLILTLFLSSNGRSCLGLLKVNARRALKNIARWIQ